MSTLRYDEDKTMTLKEVIFAKILKAQADRVMRKNKKVFDELAKH